MCYRIFISILSLFSLVASEETSSFIVNGTDASIEEFPFMASLRRNGGHICGTSILNDLWLLTAAHCVQSPASVYTVQYASTVISFPGTNVIRAAEVIPHEDYDPDNQYINDIGLVRLREPIENPLHNYEIGLAPKGTRFATGTPSVLIGWGRNESEGTQMTTLQKVELDIFSVKSCAALHKKTVHQTNICAGVIEGGKGQCTADSGGPLLVNGVQIGLVSWSEKPCAVAGFPGVYTDVSHYIDWIEQKTGIQYNLNLFLKPNKN